MFFTPVIKRVAVLLFCFLFVYSYLFYYAVFYFQLSSVKSEINEKILGTHFSSNELSFISYKKQLKGCDKKSQVHWINTREFKLNEQIYDVVYKNETIDSVFLYCIMDTEESELFSEIEEHFYSVVFNAGLKDKKGHHSKMLTKDFFCNELHFYVFHFNIPLIHFNNIVFYKHLPFLKVEISPPDFLVA